jgi:hypothetical protein
VALRLRGPRGAEPVERQGQVTSGRSCCIPRPPCCRKEWWQECRCMMQEAPPTFLSLMFYCGSQHQAKCFMVHAQILADWWLGAHQARTCLGCMEHGAYAASWLTGGWVQLRPGSAQAACAAATPVPLLPAPPPTLCPGASVGGGGAAAVGRPAAANTSWLNLCGIWPECPGMWVQAD